MSTSSPPNVGNFRFFTFQNPFNLSDTMDPNTWTITRAGGICQITDADDKIIDDPTDRGQTDLELILHGIGWMHATVQDLD